MIIYNTKGNFYSLDRTYLCQQLFMVFLELHGGLKFPLAAFAEIQDMLNSSLFRIPNQHLCLSNIKICMLVISFLISIWVLCSWLSTYFCSSFSIIICLSYSFMPSKTPMSSLNVQFDLISCGTLFLLAGQPLTIYDLSCCGWSSLTASCCVSCTVRQLGCLLSCILHLCSCSYPIFLHVYFLCSFVLRASLLWTVQICLLFLTCVDELWVLCIVVSETM